jgi:hypothetical protein
MSSPRWWRSFERMDRIFRVSANIAVAATTAAAALWIATLTLAAVACLVLATTAVLVALFSWFRRDDLASGGPSQG